MQTLSQKCKGKQTSGKGKLLLAQEKTDACDQFYTRVQIKLLKAKQRGCIFGTYPYSKQKWKKECVWRCTGGEILSITT